MEVYGSEEGCGCSRIGNFVSTVGFFLLRKRRCVHIIDKDAKVLENQTGAGDLEENKKDETGQWVRSCNRDRIGI